MFVDCLIQMYSPIDQIAELCTMNLDGPHTLLGSTQSMDKAIGASDRVNLSVVSVPGRDSRPRPLNRFMPGSGFDTFHSFNRFSRRHPSLESLMIPWAPDPWSETLLSPLMCGRFAHVSFFNPHLMLYFFYHTISINSIAANFG